MLNAIDSKGLRVILRDYYLRFAKWASNVTSFRQLFYLKKNEMFYHFEPHAPFNLFLIRVSGSIPISIPNYNWGFPCTASTRPIAVTPKTFWKWSSIACLGLILRTLNYETYHTHLNECIPKSWTIYMSQLVLIMIPNATNKWAQAPRGPSKSGKQSKCPVPGNSAGT